MEHPETSSELLALLNQAVARELQVSVQYMLQHAIEAGHGSPAAGKTVAARQARFVASHSSYFLPGPTLKKIAIAEMRHAEAIAERVVVMGGEPTTQPAGIVIGKTVVDMLENDREQERGAMQLYGQIIDVAQKQNDEVTRNLFQRILADEQRHHRVFSDLLGKD
jgi:bacterioferritin